MTCTNIIMYNTCQAKFPSLNDIKWNGVLKKEKNFSLERITLYAVLVVMQLMSNYELLIIVRLLQISVPNM